MNRCQYCRVVHARAGGTIFNFYCNTTPTRSRRKTRHHCRPSSFRTSHAGHNAPGPRYAAVCLDMHTCADAGVVFGGGRGYYVCGIINHRRTVRRRWVGGVGDQRSPSSCDTDAKGKDFAFFLSLFSLPRAAHTRPENPILHGLTIINQRWKKVSLARLRPSAGSVLSLSLSLFTRIPRTHNVLRIHDGGCGDNNIIGEGCF